MLDEIIVKEFKYIFRGSDRAYGIYNKGRLKTIRRSPEISNYQKHLEGGVGLGICPIIGTNKCKFGAIDIDERPANLKDLDKKISEKGLPLIVCRSKRGGAHLYTFFDQPIPAIQLRKSLSNWAGILGYGKAEIFPKQSKLEKGDLGNWINLPYFNVKDTDRYAIHKGKQVKIERFLQMARAISSYNSVYDSAPDIDNEGFPPCLKYAVDNGIPKGFRNEILFNLAVFLKRRNPDTWEEEIMEYNYNICKRPLPRSEMDKIIKSLNRKDYNYKCEAAFLTDHCDRLQCQQLKHGIGRLEETYGGLMVGCITKIKTIPPRWVVDINGNDYELTTEELMNYKYIRARIIEVENDPKAPMKNEDWINSIRPVLKNAKEMEAPEDASKYGQLYSNFEEFLRLINRPKAKKDKDAIIRGLPIKGKIGDNSVIFFRSHDFNRFLKRTKFPAISNQDLWINLRRMGCEHTKIKVTGKTIQVWYIERDPETQIPIIQDNIDEEDEF